MKVRIISILESLKTKGAEGLTGSIKDFRANGENSFELFVDFAKHKTFLKYEMSGKDEVLRIELTHCLGYLDLTKTDDPTEFLLGMFEQNVPSFRSSGACLGLRAGSPFPFVCSNSTHQFLATLSDYDIAEVMSLVLFDLKMGLLFTYPPPIISWD